MYNYRSFLSFFIGVQKITGSLHSRVRTVNHFLRVASKIDVKIVIYVFFLLSACEHIPNPLQCVFAVMVRVSESRIAA